LSLVPKCFPYEYPRLTQVEVWGALRGLEKNRVVFIEAPTGVGKTSAVLSFLLERYGRVLWFCYTHRQQEVVLKEVENIIRKNNININVTVIRGIKNLCPIKKVRESDLPHQLCRYYTSVKGCDFTCPYREQFLAALNSRIIVVTYNYLRQPFINKILSLIDTTDVIVLDEAHHLINPPLITIPLKWVKLALEEVNHEILEKMIKREKIVEIKREKISLSKYEEIFWKNGVSYSLEIFSKVILTQKLFYSKDTDSYLGIDDEFHFRLRKILNKPSVVISATLPKKVKVLFGSNVCINEIPRHEYKFYTLIYSKVKLPKKRWFNEATLAEINKFIDIISNYFEKILVVFPSSDTLNIFYKHFILPNNVIGIVAGSREAEGIDIDAEICVVLGVPYDRVTRITIETIRYFKKYTSKPKVLGYTIPAVIKAVQAAGRILRKPNRIVVFYDKRWIKLRNFYPKWLKNSVFKIISSKRKLIDELIYLSIICS